MQYLLRNLQRNLENKKYHHWLRIKNVVPWKKNKICASYKKTLVEQQYPQKRKEETQRRKVKSLRVFAFLLCVFA
jgi:hypothetical protein